MARKPRLIVPGCPHHLTQRGNRKLQTFFDDRDYRAFVDLLVETKARANVEVWAYCLMPNHVHLVAVPSEERDIPQLMQHSFRRYALRVNKRENWQGHLWQERYYSVAMDERHLQAAVRYVELNPVEASLCGAPWDWRWSSAGAHLRGEDDPLVTVGPLLERFPDWQRYLSDTADTDAIADLEANAKSGYPVGDESFIDHLEKVTGRTIRKKKPGPARGTKRRRPGE